MNNTRRGPLTGIRVVEYGVWHAGPGAGAILGDMGADVVKIEMPGGDPERANGGVGPLAGKTPGDPDDWGILFEFSNRNKRDISLDITTEGGRTVFEDIVRSADVFISNLRGSTRRTLGIDYEALKEIAADIVYVNVSAFGDTGPQANDGGFEPVGQAMSGMMYLAGAAEPKLLTVLVLDQMTAITASYAALAALIERGQTGEGQEVVTSLLGSAMWLTGMNLFATSVSNESLDVKWDRMAASATRTSYECRDGKWIIGSHYPPDKFWPILCRVLDREDLLEDPRFTTNQMRIENNDELMPMLDTVFRERDREEWLKLLSEAGLLFAPVYSMLDAVNSEQAALNGYMQPIHHRRLGDVRVPGFPIRFGGRTVGPVLPSPEIGEHTIEILGELGYDDVRIAKLVGDGSVLQGAGTWVAETPHADSSPLRR
ncbi:CoA transferase [Microbacterium lacus]|uniref:CaiB/BaiF CoA transferase family protein n=1 Tax=Microbacterium lacus TaxID=415217 RepID=UPI00384CB5CC